MKKTETGRVSSKTPNASNTPKEKAYSESTVPIKRENVNSTNIRSIGYNEEAKVLEVEFWSRVSGTGGRGGQIWRYWPILPEAFMAMNKAESVGSYFSANIRNNTTVTSIKVNNV